VRWRPTRLIVPVLLVAFFATPAAGAAAPSAAQLRSVLAATAQDILTNNAHAATVFYPETAYVQLKTARLANPTSDYVDRLRAFFVLDVAADYHFIRAHFQHVTYVGAVWQRRAEGYVGPGVCENNQGYWHLPGARLVFRGLRQGQSVTFSLGVDSLITSGANWYVVHLGPNPRPQNLGTVDAFSWGPGTPAGPGGC